MIISSFVSVVLRWIVLLIPTQTDPTPLAGAVYNSPAWGLFEPCWPSPLCAHACCCSWHLHFRFLMPADPCQFSSSWSHLLKHRRPPLVMSAPLKPLHNRGRKRLAEPINLQKKAAVDDRHRRLSVTIKDWCINWRLKKKSPRCQRQLFSS